MGNAWDVPGSCSNDADVTIVSPIPLPVSGTVTVNQGTSPWVVTGTITPGSVSTSVITRVPSSTSSQLLLAANASRKGVTIYNHSTADQYIKLGITASTTDFTVLLTSHSFYELQTPVYNGRIDVISSAVIGALQVTELS